MWLILVISITSLLVYLIRRQYSYWERENVPHEKLNIPFGCLDALRRQERSFGLIMNDVYMNSKEKFVGIYMFFRPALLIRDADLVRRILTSDFASFHDRGIHVDEKNDPLHANLFTLQGQSWRTLRAKLTPSFSSGKLKAMFSTTDDVGGKLVKYLEGALEGKPNGQILEMKNILTTYAVDVIGSVIFGLDIDSFANPDNEWRKLSSKLINGPRGILLALRDLTSTICPPITSFLDLLGVRDSTMDELNDMVQHTIEYREKHHILRKDLLQLLIQLRNTGKISENDDTLWNVETAAENLKAISIELISAQAFLFYIAGSETTAATASFTLYELAMHSDLLKTAQDEVEECLGKHNLKTTDKFTYEALQDMKFLDLCIMETIRKYPGLPVLNRECTQDYKVPGMDYVIKKGTPIIISLFGLHRDPEHFPNPLQYDPSRFLDEKRNYNPVAYTPFGEGPRQCIAQRMGRINAKLALAKILANFNIDPVEKKEVEFMFHRAPVLLPKDGLNIRLSKKL